MDIRKHLKDLRDLSYKSGYYAGRLSWVNYLDEKDQKILHELHAESIEKRNNIFHILEDLYEPK